MYRPFYSLVSRNKLDLRKKSTNLPGMTGYSPRVGSYIDGRGPEVFIPKGGRIF